MNKTIISLILAVGISASVTAQEADNTTVAVADTTAEASEVPSTASAAGSPDKLAQDGNFAEAIDAYEALLASGQESAELYYNLGYSYFKYGSLGKAILNFERAKRLNPSDPDVAANLEIAYALTDKMEIVQPPITDRIWESIKEAFSSDGWAWMFIICFVLTLTGIGMFLFLDSVTLRKVGFFSAIVFLVVSVTSLCISLSKRSEAINGSEAIIMSSSADLNTSPDKNATRMTVLHEGTYVKIIDTLGDWIEVRLRDGNIGWMRQSDVEVI